MCWWGCFRLSVVAHCMLFCPSVESGEKTIKCSAVLMVYVSTAAATAAVLCLFLCPWVIPDSPTGEQLIGRSPGGAQDKEGEEH